MSSSDKPDPAIQPPRWVEDVRRSLSIRAQFVLYGNIRDSYLVPLEGKMVAVPMISCLWEALSPEGYQFFLVYDPVDGIRIYPEAQRGAAGDILGIKFTKDVLAVKMSLDKLTEHMGQVVHSKQHRAAVVIDYASRIAPSPQELGDGLQKFFVGCEKLANTARPRNPQSHGGALLYNPVLWLINCVNDLPAWFHVGNDGIKNLLIPMPDSGERRIEAGLLGPKFQGFPRGSTAAQASLLDTFVALTDGMSLRSMEAIQRLAAEPPTIAFDRVADAVRFYKVGVLDDPWKKDHVRRRIREGAESINKDVKGQDAAIKKTLDILKRSVMGMTGAHVSARSGRPRGVLFFAGPTGVGKTELAKAITRVIFGDERAYVRFDMSEFSAEQSDQRLIGAPPGYIGYDAGGELTNAIRQRPFSVILFDEIEKAHPRILDKFLQILEDGRLTDGRGDTVYFSEAIIVFTSNLGVYVPRASATPPGVPHEQSLSDGGLVENVKPDMKPEEVEKRIRAYIEKYFKFHLNRPELLNRIGENIVVFNFIQPPIAKLIFDKMFEAVLRRVRETHGIDLVLEPKDRETIQDWCIADMSNGGRGIGNRIETVFVNPLSRGLFELDDRQMTGAVTVRAVVKSDGERTVEVA